MGNCEETRESGNASKLATVTAPPSAGLPRPKQKRRGGAFGSAAACTMYTTAFGGVLASAPPSFDPVSPLVVTSPMPVSGPGMDRSGPPPSCVGATLSSPAHPAADIPPKPPPRTTTAAPTRTHFFPCIAISLPKAQAEDRSRPRAAPHGTVARFCDACTETVKKRLVCALGNREEKSASVGRRKARWDRAGAKTTDAPSAGSRSRRAPISADIAVPPARRARRPRRPWWPRPSRLQARRPARRCRCTCRRPRRRPR